MKLKRLPQKATPQRRRNMTLCPQRVYWPTCTLFTICFSILTLESQGTLQPTKKSDGLQILLVMRKDPSPPQELSVNVPLTRLLAYMYPVHDTPMIYNSTTVLEGLRTHHSTKKDGHPS